MLTLGIRAQALGVQESEDGGITLTSKKVGNPQQPGSNIVTTTWGPNASNRK